MFSKELLSALAGAVVLEVGKQTVGFAGCKLGEYCYSHVAKGGKSVLGELKDEGHEMVQDIIGLVSPRKAEEGRVTLHKRWRREMHDEQAIKEKIERVRERKLGEGRSRSLDRNHGQRLTHRSSPKPRSRSLGGHVNKRHHEPHHERSSNDASLRGQHDYGRHGRPKNRSVDENHGRRPTVQSPRRARSHGHDEDPRKQRTSQGYYGFNSNMERPADTSRVPDPATSKLYYLNADDIRRALRIEQHTMDSQAAVAENSRNSPRVRDNRARIETIDDSFKYGDWKHDDKSCILIINGNDTGYRGEPISIFSHAVEQKYVHFKQQPHTSAIRCYVGCWREFSDAKGPVETMMRSLCWQLLKFPIPTFSLPSNPGRFMVALRQFELDALCTLFKELCIVWSRLDLRELKRLVILIDGGSIFEMQQEDSTRKYETFKKAINAIHSAVTMLRDLGDPVVLKFLLLFAGRPSDVPEREGLVRVLTLPRMFGPDMLPKHFEQGRAEEIRIPRW